MIETSNLQDTLKENMLHVIAYTNSKVGITTGWSASSLFTAKIIHDNLICYYFELHNLR